jgi:GTP diphosphokinase / guanosine-3',5'-bis(diphosphate) 3'-diphosphatase
VKKTAEAPIEIQTLLESLPPDYNLMDREMLIRAYHAAETAHEGQKRASGEPYINHCVAVAAILAEMHVPPEVIAAGLLHDTVEDTKLSLGDIRRDFGETVAKLVDGVPKLSHLPRVSRGDHHEGENGDYQEIEDLSPEQLSRRKKDLATETLRKTFLAMGEDVRVVLIKLADRLHNMRTLSFTKPDKQKRIAQETLDIFAPLANRLGIWQMKWELEDLGFRYVNPEKYKEIAEQLAERRDTREQQIDEIVVSIQKLLAQNHIKSDVFGRPKHIYSIYRKMQLKGKAFEMVRDVRAVRVIVPDISSCYVTLGIVHARWRPIPSEFDDYIAAPKDNFYQSLHTAVIYDDGKPLEVQIRTAEMHQNAEYGIAAHWRYKEGGKPVEDAYEQRILWLRRMMEWRQDVDDAQEFVDGMKTDVFQDRVYVFTPRGDIIDLPSGSTPIDFAYHVHTDVGHHCRGAKVAGKLVPLDHALQTGDQVEILAAKQGGPSRDWLNPSLGLVRTQRARSKIKAWFKKQDKDQNISQGRDLLARELQRLGLSEINLEDMARELEFTSAEEMFEAIGCGDITTGRIFNRLSNRYIPIFEQEDVIPVSAPKSEPASSEAVKVLGLKGLLTTMAKCCNPAPGDPIVGYITRGRGATVHRQDCPNVLHMTMNDRDRLVLVNWGEHIHTYPVPIRISAYDRHGLMGDISNLMVNEGINIVDVNVHIDRDSIHADVADMRLVVEVKDLEQLSRLLTKIENLPNVMEAQRLRGG